MDRRNDTAVEALMERLIEHGPSDIATVFGRAFELAMQIERERYLGAGLHERTDTRRSYANGYKSKRIDTPAGTAAVAVYLRAWDTGSEARAGLRDWFEFYNHRRPHAALDGQPPDVVYQRSTTIMQPDQEPRRVA